MTKIAMLFPGQGSQFVGMGKELYQDFTVAKEAFEEANEILGFDLKKLCFEGDFKELTQTENAQPALLTTSVAMFRVYMEEIGVKPSILAGHSLGEFSALTCSNVIDFSDALKIVRKRGLLMQQANKLSMGKMVAISGIDFEILDEERKRISTVEAPVVIACHNSPSQNVISGHVDAVDKLAMKLEKLGASVMSLKVSAAFHSPMMQHAAEELRIELRKYTYNNPEWKVISNVNALPYNNSSEVIENLTKQMTYPVLWNNAMNYIDKQDVDIALELGPKMVLKNLMKENIANIPVFQFESKSEIEKLKQTFIALTSTEEQKVVNEKLSIISNCIAAAVCTKNSNWDLNTYNKGVSKPLKELKKMYEMLVMNRKEPLDEEIIAALEMLHSVLLTKNVSTTEQEKIFFNILNKIEVDLIISTSIKKYTTKTEKSTSIQ